MKKLWTYWLVIGFLLLLLIFLYTKSESDQSAELKQVSHAIAHLKNDDARLNDALLNVHLNVAQHYQDLLNAQQQVNRSQEDFFKQLRPEIQLLLKPFWDIFSKQLIEKNSQIEKIKSLKSILKNSVAFFPKGINQLQKQLIIHPENLQYNPHLVAIINRFYQYQINKTDSDKEKLSDLVDNIAFNMQYPANVANLIDNIIAHKNVIINYHSTLEDLFNKTHTLDLQNDLETVLDIYMDDYQQRQKLADKYKMAMLIIAILLIIVVLYSIRMIQKTSEKLELSIIDLNFQKFALDQHAIVSIADVKGNITYINDKFHQISGYTLDELIGKNHRVVKSDMHDDAFFKNMWKTIAKGKVWQGEIKNIAKNGSHYWVNSTIVPFLDKNGKPFQYISIRTDITKRKHNEEELLLAKKQSDEANRMKSDFLANMSHEIRTPMNAIIGMSYLALQTNLNKKQKNYIEKVHFAAESLLRIINDILDFSKIEAGKLEIEQTSFCLDEVFDNLANMLCNKVVEKNVEFLFATDKDVPLYLIGDPLRLTQVLLNLTNNAYKFTEEGEVIVRTSIHQQQNTFTELKFEVQDTGIGLTQQQQDKLFHSFTQVDSSTTRKFGGTGLGLAISKDLVELMGGRIWVESEYQQGSRFYFTVKFPLADEKAEQSKQKNMLPLSFAGKEMLIVDDKASARNVLYEMASNLQFNVQTANDGKEAIEKIRHNIEKKINIDVILMDWQMPDLDGLNCITKMQQLFQNDIPNIILVTAYGKEEVSKKSKELSVHINNILTKPITHTALLNALQHLYQSSSDNNYVTDDLQKHVAQLQGSKILLVEDNILNQELATELLKSKDISVVVANNGLEGVELCSKQVFDGILMDVQMPVMDGYQATEEIRKFNKGLPIIAMTANAMVQDQKSAMDAGMNGFVTKPINVRNLFATMSKWINTDKTISNEPFLVENSVEQAEKHSEALGKEKILDVNSAMERMMDDENLYIKILQTFLAEHSESMQYIRECLDSHNLSEALLHSHSLKGVASNIGANLLSTQASQLENSLRNDSFDSSQADQQLRLQDLHDVFLKTLAAVNAFIEKSNKAEVSDDDSDIQLVGSDVLLTELQELLQLLESYSATSVEKLDKILEMNVAKADKEQLKYIYNQIEKYDFEEAEVLVKQFIAQLEK